MDLLVRPARPEDAGVPLLFESAKPYYTAYAGSERGALKLLHRVWERPGHAASFEFCHVATTRARPAHRRRGGIPRARGRPPQPALHPAHAPARRRRGACHKTFAHLYAAGGVAPQPPLDAFYVDALAVAHNYRRQGIAQRLLETAERLAVRHGCQRVALDTGLQNLPGPRAL